MPAFVRSLPPGMPLLSYLDVTTYCYDSPQDFEHPMGRATCCFCLLVRGSVTVQSAQGEVQAHSGQVIFWPECVPYHSFWSSDGPVEFIGVYFRLRGVRVLRNGATQNHPLDFCDRFVVIPEKRWLPVFRQIDGDYHHSRRMERALSGFYKLYQDIVPQLPAGKPLRPIIRRAQAFMEQNWERDFRMAELAAHCQLSESRLSHLFKEETSLSPVEYKNRVRIRRAADMLLSEDASVEWISERMHYSSPAYFRRVFRKYMGMTPSAYRAAGGLTL